MLQLHHVERCLHLDGSAHDSPWPPTIPPKPVLNRLNQRHFTMSWHRPTLNFIGEPGFQNFNMIIITQAIYSHLHYSQHWGKNFHPPSPNPVNPSPWICFGDPTCRCGDRWPSPLTCQEEINDLDTQLTSWHLSIVCSVGFAKCHDQFSSQIVFYDFLVEIKYGLPIPFP